MWNGDSKPVSGFARSVAATRKVTGFAHRGGLAVYRASLIIEHMAELAVSRLAGLLLVFGGVMALLD